MTSFFSYENLKKSMKNSNCFFIDKKDINFVQTLMCGQIFSYKQFQDKFLILSGNKKAEVFELETNYKIVTADVDYFKNFFDLKTDYEKIKQRLLKKEKAEKSETKFNQVEAKFKPNKKNLSFLIDNAKFDFFKNTEILSQKNLQKNILKEAIKFGSGIRILKQDLLEVIISFVFSANNNIKRITESLFKLREKFGTKQSDFFAFPTLNQLQKIGEKDFKEIGAGYRSAQLVKLIEQIKEIDLEKLKNLETEILRKELIELSGIGPKVADCILLFGFGRTDVFPVDTWINQVFNSYFGKNENKTQIRKFLIKEFGDLSGYAQQYLFYYQRSFVNKS